LRLIWLGLVSLLSGACLGPVPEPLRDTVLASNGLQISFSGCLLSGDYLKNGNVQLSWITLRDSRGVRTDPTFGIAKKTISRDFALDASHSVMWLQQQFDWICGEHPGDSPERRAAFERFRADALVAMVETALRFEKLATEAEFREEIAAARKLWESFEGRKAETLGSQ